MLVLLIVACEIAFWVLLGAGLAARYLLRRPGLSAALLLSVPLVDLVLLGATVVDLQRGATATAAHGLAAAYIGFSVAFGHGIIRWADERFAHRFAGGPPPQRPPRYGRERTRHEWREWGKALLGWAVACGLLLAAILLVDDAARTEQLRAWIARLSLVLVVWLIGWPVADTIWPRKPPAPDATPWTKGRAT
jgi:hypothetical protein